MYNQFGPSDHYDDAVYLTASKVHSKLLVWLHYMQLYTIN